MRQRFATVPTAYMLEDLNGVQVAGLFYEPEMVHMREKERMQNIMWKKYWHTEPGKDKNKCSSNGKDIQIHSTHGNQQAI